MTTKRKPKHTLLSGRKAEDVNALAKLYETMTGRKPTPAEMEAARKKLDA